MVAWTLPDKKTKINCDRNVTESATLPIHWAFGCKLTGLSLHSCPAIVMSPPVNCFGQVMLPFSVLRSFGYTDIERPKLRRANARGTDLATDCFFQLAALTIPTSLGPECLIVFAWLSLRGGRDSRRGGQRGGAAK